MKKTLIALAVLGVSTSGSALAADVQVYGLVDLGLKYVHKDYDGTKDNTNSLEVASGSWNGSRFGIKGSEDLGNGLKVGFVLENGIKADEGSLANNGRIFGRE